MSVAVKGGYAEADWQDRYARQFEALGWTPYEAASAALNAWEVAEDDEDPVDAAITEISYMAEDAA